MANKTVPRFRVKIYDPADNFNFLRHMIACDDQIRELVKHTRTEATGLPLGGTLGPTESVNQWQQQPEFTEISQKLKYIEFGFQVGEGARGVLSNPDGTAKVGGDGIVGGFVIAPTVNNVHCVINAGANDPTPAANPDYDILEFEQIVPKLTAGQGRFETILPDGKDYTYLYFNSQLPNKVATARTVLSLKKNQQFGASITIIAPAAGHTTRAGIRLSWAGEKYSIVLRDGAVPVLERKVGGRNEVWTQLGGEKVKFVTGQSYVISVENVGGRLLITINGKRVDVLDTAVAATSSTPAAPPVGAPPAQPAEEPRIVQWPKGKLQFRCFGVQAVFGFSTLDCLEPITDPDTGVVTIEPIKDCHVVRRVRRALPPGLTWEKESLVRGFMKLGTSIVPDVTIDQYGLEWTATLNASPDGLSPMLCAFMAGARSVPDIAGPVAFDVSRAFIEASETTASPEIQVGGSTWNIELDRLNLETMAAALGIDWTTKIRQDSRVTFEVSWRKSDGTFTPWVMRLDGYVSEDAKSSPHFGERHLSLTCRDQTYRVMGNNAVIDGRYPPLDVLLFNNPGAPLFGWQMVQYLLKIGIGDDVAASMVTYLNAGHWPLIGNTSDAVGYLSTGLHPHVQNSPAYPPPFDQSLHEWIQQIAAEDMYIFFWSFDPATSTSSNGPPVPVYGDIREIMHACPAWYLPDAIYAPGDLDMFMGAVEVHTRADAKFNEVIVYGPTGNKIIPALPFYTGVARLPASDPNSVENTGWRKTMVVREPEKFKFPGVVFAVASQLMKALEGGNIKWPSITLPRGEEHLWWGHKIIPKMEKDNEGDYSDADLKLDGLHCRVLRVSNKYSATQAGRPASFTSSLAVFPLTAAEVAADFPPPGP